MDRPIFTLFNKVQAMIANVYTVSEIGVYTIDESKIPPECQLPNHTSTRDPSPKVELEPKPLTVDQSATNPETRSQNAAEFSHRLTAAVELPGRPGTLNDADITNGSRKIADSPVSVQDIWPFIQQIATSVRECGYDSPGEGMLRLSTMTLADIQASRPERRISTTAPSTDDAPENIRIRIPSAHSVVDDQEPPRSTVLTPSACTTEGSSTPTHEEALVGRDIVREEVNRALAGAVATLAGLLSRDVGGATCD